jgi:hypothetical protein
VLAEVCAKVVVIGDRFKKMTTNHQLASNDCNWYTLVVLLQRKKVIFCAVRQRLGIGVYFDYVLSNQPMSK